MIEKAQKVPFERLEKPLTLAEAIEMVYRVQDLHRDLVLELLRLKGQDIGVGPSGRRGYSTMEEVLIALEDYETEFARIRVEIQRLRAGENSHISAQISNAFSSLTGQPRFFMPVQTLEELDTFNKDDLVNGYHAGRRNDPEPFNKGKGYWHGWRNGMIDNRHMKGDAAYYLLAKLTVEALHRMKKH